MFFFSSMTTSMYCCLYWDFCERDWGIVFPPITLLLLTCVKLGVEDFLGY